MITGLCQAWNGLAVIDREALGDLVTHEWVVPFDASPKPSIDRFATLDTDSRHPSGVVQVIRLSEEEHPSSKSRRSGTRWFPSAPVAFAPEPD